MENNNQPPAPKPQSLANKKAVAEKELLAQATEILEQKKLDFTAAEWHTLKTLLRTFELQNVYNLLNS